MFHRFNNSSSTPNNTCDWAMFAKNQDAVSHYGKYHWTFDGKTISADDVIGHHDVRFVDAILMQNNRTKLFVKWAGGCIKTLDQRKAQIAMEALNGQ